MIYHCGIPQSSRVILSDPSPGGTSYNKCLTPKTVDRQGSPTTRSYNIGFVNLFGGIVSILNNICMLSPLLWCFENLNGIVMRHFCSMNGQILAWLDCVKPQQIMVVS